MYYVGSHLPRNRHEPRIKTRSWARRVLLRNGRRVSQLQVQRQLGNTVSVHKFSTRWQCHGIEDKCAEIYAPRRMDLQKIQTRNWKNAPRWIDRQIPTKNRNHHRSCCRFLIFLNVIFFNKLMLYNSLYSFHC